MANGMTPLKQVSLPFAEGEATHAERWNDLGIALLRIPPKQCTAHLAGLVRWIFNVTGGGMEGALTKSYEELAQRPWGLCCNERTARRTVDTACRYGLINAAEQRRWDGSQQCNAYTIDWEGIAALKLGRRTDGHSVHPPGHTDHRGGQDVRHIKEFSLMQSSVRKNSGTGPGADPNPRMDSENETDGSRPRMAASHRRQNDSLTESLLANSPILAAARERRIAPLPACNLVHGVFAAIEPKDIYRLERFVKWHRMQLSTAEPVMGGTEADLLLTIATVLYARSLPESEVRKNRAAVFVSTIARRAFLKSLPFVPEARMLLDGGIAKLGATWAGLAEEVSAK